MKNIKIEKVTLDPKLRKLDARWTIDTTWAKQRPVPKDAFEAIIQAAEEDEYDIQALHSLKLEAELAKILAEEIDKEIIKEIQRLDRGLK